MARADAPRRRHPRCARPGLERRRRNDPRHGQGRPHPVGVHRRRSRQLRPRRGSRRRRPCRQGGWVRARRAPADVDPYKNSDSQHESAVEPDSFSFGSTVVAAFQVGRRENGASANIGTAVSTDAGRTWRRAYLFGTTVNASPPGSEVGASDPSVAYDAVHGYWLVSTLTIERARRMSMWRARPTGGAGRRRSMPLSGRSSTRNGLRATTAP